MFLEKRILIVYLCDKIEKLTAAGVDQFDL